MKKKTINAFTLVEMLIVIVIIGILIAALMPRMQAAQGRARDVSRKTALAQIQTAIVTYQGDKGKWPAIDSGAKQGMAVSGISEQLRIAGMNSVPVDPISSNVVSIGDSGEVAKGEYGYLVLKRNGTNDGGFALIAHTEVEGGSNWVTCSGATDLSGGLIKNSDDISSIQLCTEFDFNKNGTDCKVESGTCTYNMESELRYITVY